MITNIIAKLKKFTFRKLFDKIKKNFFTLSCVPGYILFTQKRIRIDGKKEYVLFNFTLIGEGRRLYQILTQFLFCGYTCILNFSFRQYMDIVDLDYNRKTLLTKDIFPAMVFSIRNEDKPYTCVVSDNNMSPQKGDVRSLHIYINQHIFNNLYNIMINDLFYPILVHPIHSSAGLEDEISKHSAFNDRKIGALFVGNIDGGYNKNITRKLCGYTRKEIFFHVSNTLPGDILYFPKTIKEFEDKITTGELRHKIVLLDVQVFAIPAKKYFEILLESNFFIFMPGHIQPYCHNQIESMLAGCIPITHLKKFFFPPFENKYNSLLFDSLDSLTRLLNDVSRGEYESFLPFMRNNILNYYERNYSYQSLRNKISILIDNKIEYTNYYVPSSDIDVLNASI